MDDVISIPLKCDPDIPWRVALFTGEAAQWNLASIARQLARSNDVACVQERRAGIFMRRMMRLIGELPQDHPLRNVYVLAILQIGEADIEWAMSLVRPYPDGRHIPMVMRLMEYGVPPGWVREMLGDSIIHDDRAEVHRLVMANIITVGEGMAIIEARPRHSGRAAAHMLKHDLVKASWAMVVVMADPDDREQNIEILKGIGSPKRSIPGRPPYGCTE